jgi:hypothetical protein
LKADFADGFSGAEIDGASGLFLFPEVSFNLIEACQYHFFFAATALTRRGRAKWRNISALEGRF